MRKFIFACALLSAGCATSRSGSFFGPPSPSFVVPDGTTSAPEPETGWNLLAPRPAGAAQPAAPTQSAAPSRSRGGMATRGLGRYFTQMQPRQGPAVGRTFPGTGARPTPSTGATLRPSPNRPTGRIPAGAAPASNQPTPRIPDPNAALPGPSHSTRRIAAQSTEEADESREPVHRRTTVQTPAPAEPRPPWRQVGLSSGGRPIEMLQLGRGERHLLVMGSLVGNEPRSVTFVESLAGRLHGDPERLGDWTVIFVRTPNPDGLAELTQTNSRGVSLNRNFPSDNFFGHRTEEVGLTPASEPETKAIVYLCDDFRPDRVVHVRAGQAARLLVLANARASDGLRQRIDRSVMDGGEFEAYKAGSIEEYAADQLESELFLVYLPGDDSWKSQMDRIASVILGEPASAVRPASQSPQEDAVEITRAVTNEPKPPVERKTRPDLFAPYEPPAAMSAASVAAAAAAPARGKKGFVEILPPPPDVGDGGAALYFELPPPPE